MFCTRSFFPSESRKCKKRARNEEKKSKKIFFLNLQENVSINKYRISLFNLYLKNSDCIST